MVVRNGSATLGGAVRRLPHRQRLKFHQSKKRRRRAARHKGARLVIREREPPEKRKTGARSLTRGAGSCEHG
jgi:hypothetical protein